MKIKFISVILFTYSLFFPSLVFSSTIESKIIQSLVIEKLKTVVVVLSYSKGVREQRELEDETGNPSPKTEGFVNGQRIPENLISRPGKIKEASGTGFVIESNGYIISNYHVIKNSIDHGRIIVYFLNDEEYEAKLVGYDIFSDIAVLKIKSDENFPFVKFAKTNHLGETVFAIGHPIGLNFSISKGMVSANGRYFKKEASFMEYIQTDASINKGNSGGPLFNLQGNVIGVNSIIVSPAGGSVGLGFAIPSEIVELVSKNIIQFGKMKWGGIGLMYRNIPKGRRIKYGLKINEGVLVHKILFHKPAMEAGIKKDDILLQIDGVPIKTILFPRMISRKIPGVVSEILGLRNGEEIKFKVTINNLSDNMK